MNKELLRYEMARHGISVDEMTQRLGISRSAFWKKCTGVSEFKQSEIAKIIEILDLKNPADIFFAGEVS